MPGVLSDACWWRDEPDGGTDENAGGEFLEVSSPFNTSGGTGWSRSGSGLGNDFEWGCSWSNKGASSVAYARQRSGTD